MKITDIHSVVAVNSSTNSNMKIKFLGTGTSYGVPQIGCNCEVCLSDDPRDHRTRSSIWLQGNQKSIVIDTGPDFRFQCLRSKISKLDAVLFTHFHADHVFGIDDIRQFNTLQKTKIPIFVPDFMVERFQMCFGYTLSTPEAGLNRPRLLLHTVSNDPITFDDLLISPIDVYHGSERVKGYVLYKNSIKISYLTDCKSLPDESIEQAYDSDIMILSALWTGSHRHPAHLNLNEALDLAQQLRAGTTYLTHITHKMGLHIQTSRILPPNVFLAYDGFELDI